MPNRISTRHGSGGGTSSASDHQRNRRHEAHEHPDRDPSAVEPDGNAKRHPRRRRRRSRRRRYLRWLLAAAVLIVVVLLALLVVLGLGAYRAYPAAADLLAGREAMAAGQRAAAAGDLPQASAAFDRGSQAFARAEQQLTASPVRVARAIPVAGRTFTAVVDLAAAGGVLGDAALEVSQGLESLPEGALTLAPEDGAIPLEPIQAMQPVLASALRQLREAEYRLAGSPHSLLAPPVRDAQLLLAEQLEAGNDMLTTAEGLARALPPFLGADGPRRYFFGAANPAEVRGTGGLLGAYAIMTADGGELELSEFVPHRTLPVLPAEDVEAPNSDFARRYNQFGGAGLLVNSNMTPDFPSAAIAIENLYEAGMGERLDGVVVADPFALQALLELTGPAQVPGIGRVDADGVVEFLANRAYENFTDQAERKSVLGDVAEAVLDRFLEGDIDAPPAKVASALGRAAAQRRLQLHATDPAVQEGLHAAGLTGALPLEGGDFLAVVPNNGAANKADYFMDWDIDYEVWLESGGDARAQVTVEGFNATPQRGPRRYVIGPNVSYLQAGDNLTYLTVLCAPGCEHSHAKQNDAQDFWRGTEVDTELGFTALSSWQWASSQGTTDMQYTLQMYDVWTDAGADGGQYTLRLQTPPLARPADVNVVIHPPHPLQVADVSAPLEIQAGQAVWAGALEQPLEVNVDLERPTRDAVTYRLRSYADRVREFWGRRL